MKEIFKLIVILAVVLCLAFLAHYLPAKPQPITAIVVVVLALVLWQLFCILELQIVAKRKTSNRLEKADTNEF